MDFELTAEFQPTGDQPEAIQQLVEGLTRGDEFQTLLGVTGSGKTFTIANVIQEVKRPTLILSHNNPLAAQLYGELKQFFPNNAVEYFVSYYDYYQPEAYLPVTNTYIEKDLSINDEIEKLRLSTTSSLLSGRRDVIVISSVSCIYGIGNPDDFSSNVISIRLGDKISRNKFLLDLVTALYSRTETDFFRGNFRVKGDTVDIFPAVCVNDLSDLRKPSLSASRIATKDTSGRSKPSLNKFTPTSTSKTPSRRSRIISTLSSVSTSEWM